jgi:subtilisin family serine protease
MKQYFYLLLIILFCLVGNAQNLPKINVAALPKTAYENNAISIKFLPSSFSKNKLYNNATLLRSNNVSLNNIAIKYSFIKATPIFAKSLQDERFSNLHTNSGLQLWFTISLKTNVDIVALINELMATHLFEIVEPVYKKHLLNEKPETTNWLPNDFYFNLQWGYKNTGQGGGTIGKDINLENAWNIETGNPNIIVAVNDQGVQLDHPDLAQNIAIGKGFNFVNNSNVIVPGYHGTHVAGTIAAVNNNSIGVSGIAGGNGLANSGVRIMSCQIFDGNKSGGLADCFVYSADNGACISNNSWAYNEEFVYELSVIEAIDYFVANAGGNNIKGGLVVFAAGNVSSNIQYFPPAYDKVICVAATTNKDEKAPYSTYGSWVDISAPGGYFAYENQILSTSTSSSYRNDHGTSMSCPHVSGVAALVASQLIGKTSASDIIEILLSTTDTIDFQNPSFINQLGTGRLNAFRAVAKANEIANKQFIAPVDSFALQILCDSIVLTWKPNSNNNAVIIVYNDINIGNIVDGKNYAIGDTLNNGGTIIYKGFAKTLTLPNNKNNIHFFKIYSTTANNNYSLGNLQTSSFNTFINQSNNYFQNFDYTPLYPNLEWKAINANNDITWTHTVVDTANTGANDLFGMCMYNYKYNNTLAAIDVLTSPQFQMHNPDSIILSFWWAYKYKNTGLPIADSLEVLATSNCGKTFTSIWKFGGQQLATILDTTNTEFYPFSGVGYKQANINISNLKKAKNLQFYFKSTNGKGNNLFLDNINIKISYNNDANILSYLEPIINDCSNYIAPKIIVKNNGNNTITNLKIGYTIDNNLPVFTNFTGTILKDSLAKIGLTNVAIAHGKHTIKSFISNINNGIDGYNNNDTLINSFTINQPNNLPLFEGFEGAIFPPKNWSIHQEAKDQLTWCNYNNVGANSNKCAAVQNFVYNNNGMIDDLISPVFIMDKTMDSAFLSFDYAHANRNFASTTDPFDTLQIDLSRDCGTTWQTIWKKWGNDLQTINQTQPLGYQFFPAANQWNHDSLLIANSFKKDEAIKIRFRNIQNWGNTVLIDNISLRAVYYAPTLLTNGYAIYPNPIKNFLIIEHLNAPTTLTNIRLINSLGQVVLIKNYSANANKIIQLPTEKLATGVYFLQVMYSNLPTITQKIMKP